MENTENGGKLAIFDLDNTLIKGDSDYLWGEFLAERGIVDPHHYRDENERYYQQYKDGELDIYEFLAFSLKPLSEHAVADLQAWRSEFIQQRIQPLLLENAQALVEHHRRSGHFLLIITATNRFVTEPIAELFGIDNLLATDPEVKDDRYTGRVEGIACFKEGKIKRLEQWLQQQKLTNPESWFYSDSHNDIPLLSQVDHPVAVDPDPELERHARQKGWPLLSLR